MAATCRGPWLSSMLLAVVGQPAWSEDTAGSSAGLMRREVHAASFVDLAQGAEDKQDSIEDLEELEQEELHMRSAHNHYSGSNSSFSPDDEESMFCQDSADINECCVEATDTCGYFRRRSSCDDTMECHDRRRGCCEHRRRVYN
mmetsp:Transcript_43835/g.82207  ORF Transcript_43835/g.82207 Transcript_43835/m.82207 type:complete len:144 (+) Transcript_43835:40-471(+)